jgi:cytochrome c-type biogenesis protein
MSPLLLPAAALIAGALSISSPCCLPLLPGYLSYIGALPAETTSRRSVAFGASIRFVAGFTAVFTLLGATASLISVVLIRNIDVIVRIAGVGIIILGVSLTGLFRIPFLQREGRPGLAMVTKAKGGAFFLGVAFAFGWTPCIGPVLATILTLSASSRSVLGGTSLLIIYSVGLGIPFVALALGFHRMKGALGVLQRHGQLIEQLSGILLVTVGVLYVTGQWAPLFRPMQTWFAQFGWPPV